MPRMSKRTFIGDHGTSQVFLWSGARIGGVPIAALLKKRGETGQRFAQKSEKDVRYANITIIEGHDASQYGIGIISARIGRDDFARRTRRGSRSVACNKNLV